MPARKHVLDIPSEVMALPLSELGRILACAMHDAESDDDDECIEAWILEQSGVPFDGKAEPGKLRAVQ